MSSVFVLGGTGFLGYHATRELLKRGYTVSIVSRYPIAASDLLPPEVECRFGDINEMSDSEVSDLLAGKDMFVFAAGADERVIPDAPAAKFYYKENVLPTQRMARLAREAGVKRFVIYGSYFAHFAERWPEIELKKQAYVKSRLLQEEVAILEGEDQMDVITLRLPYVFGTTPGRVPIWSMFFSEIRGKDFVPVLGGGTAMVTVQQVAEATVGALENGEHGEKYAIGDTNMKHAEFFRIIADLLGQKETVIQPLPLEHVREAYALVDEHTLAAGKEHGIHIAVIADVQSRDAYLDPEDTMTLLKYNKADVRAAIVETIKLCVEMAQ